MKTIGIDGHVLTGKYQGSRTYLQNLLERVGRIDRDNRYIVYSFDPEATRAMLPGVRFWHRVIPRMPPSARLLFYWPYVQMRDDLDLLLTQYVSPLVFPHRQMVVVHDTLVHSHPDLFPFWFAMPRRVLGRLSARRARAIFVVSETTRRDAIRHLGVSPIKVHLTRNGIAVNCTGDGGGTDHAEGFGRYILSVGRIEPRKNLDVLIRAFRRLARPGLSLVIVGAEDFSPGAVLGEIAATSGVVHLQNADAATLAGLYRHAALFVYPSLAEGFGFPLLEALSHHLPVISSDRTSMPEVAGPFARYFDPRASDSEDRLVALMAEELDSPRVDRSAEIDRHLAQFDWDRSAATFVDTVNSL